MAKCDKCLRGARISITGVNPHNTLSLDMGGATLYIIPKQNGDIDVTLNSESLVDGDYASAYWDGNQWRYATGDAMNMG